MDEVPGNKVSFSADGGKHLAQGFRFQTVKRSVRKKVSFQVMRKTPCQGLSFSGGEEKYPEKVSFRVMRKISRPRLSFMDNGDKHLV